MREDAGDIQRGSQDYRRGYINMKTIHCSPAYLTFGNGERKGRLLLGLLSTACNVYLNCISKPAKHRERTAVGGGFVNGSIRYLVHLDFLQCIAGKPSSQSQPELLTTLCAMHGCFLKSRVAILVYFPNTTKLEMLHIIFY